MLIQNKSEDISPGTSLAQNGMGSARNGARTRQIGMGIE